MKNYTDHIRLLHKARKRIELEQDDFICLALMRVVDQDNKEELLTALKLRYWIRKMLDSSQTLEEWLYVKHNIGTPEGDSRRRNTRLRWINWMIKELQ